MPRVEKEWKEGGENTTYLTLENISTNRTGRLVARAEPPVQTRAVELLLARFARQLRQLAGVLVDDAVAHVALLDALELAVQVALPQREPVPDGTVLLIAGWNLVKIGC